MINKPLLVIVNGAPGAGKTILGKKLARQLRVPYISKDDIKEALFDTLGWQDKEWSKKLNLASIKLLFHILSCQLEARQSVVVETAFLPSFDTARFLELKSRYDFEPYQIFCWADERVLFERFKGRIEVGERHPGHIDQSATWDQFKAVLGGGKYGVLDIGGTLVELDTTDFKQLDQETLPEITRMIQTRLRTKVE